MTKTSEDQERTQTLKITQVAQQRGLQAGLHAFGLVGAEENTVTDVQGMGRTPKEWCQLGIRSAAALPCRSGN